MTEAEEEAALREAIEDLAGAKMHVYQPGGRPKTEWYAFVYTSYGHCRSAHENTKLDVMRRLLLRLLRADCGIEAPLHHGKAFMTDELLEMTAQAKANLAARALGGSA